MKKLEPQQPNTRVIQCILDEMKAVIKIEEDVDQLDEMKSENTEQLKNIQEERQQIELTKKENTKKPKLKLQNTEDLQKKIQEGTHQNAQTEAANGQV